MPDRPATKVFVDISLFTTKDSFGHINGEMLFSLVPGVGDAISFDNPESNGELGLIGVVHVESVLHISNAPLLMLSDLYVATKEDAVRVSRFLERHFDLFANIHDENDLRAYMDQERKNGCLRGVL